MPRNDLGFRRTAITVNQLQNLRVFSNKKSFTAATPLLATNNKQVNNVAGYSKCAIS